MKQSAGNMSFGDPKGREEFLSKAGVYLDQDLPEKAAALARERLDHFPGDVDARIIVGSSMVKMGRMEEALGVLKGVDDDILSWSRVFERLGDIYREKDLPQEAIIAYQRFILLNPGSPITKDVSAKLDSLISSLHGDIITGAEKVLSEEKRVFVINELNRWLKNLNKMKRYAAS